VETEGSKLKAESGKVLSVEEIAWWLGYIRNNGEKVYQTHRAKSLPPDCLNVAVRLGFVQRPQVW